MLSLRNLSKLMCRLLLRINSLSECGFRYEFILTV